MNRIDRLTAIIIYLQGRTYVTVEDLSERYGISGRTVYRDLAALQEAGVPIGSEPGRGYFIVKGYHLPPVMFDRNEASALLAGERLMQKWNHTEIGKSYLSALDKVRSVLPPDEKEYFEIQDEHMQAFHYKNEHLPQPDDRIFVWMQKAIFKKEVIEICYESPYKGEKITRNIEPLGLLLKDNQWYLAAWCRLRKDYRMFRLDRFHDFKLTGKKLPDSSDHTLKEFHARNLDKERELTEVTIWFKQDMVRLIGDSKYHHGWAWEKEVDDGLEITFLTSHPEYLARWSLLWGNGAKVLKPESVKEKAKALVKELYEHY
ncbi:helix-turn-helix transcriptional regulator [Gracilimonas mengyeensis]|uniref:Predicted DNA-binding transcriptional regulator YafY, contains an HTH and WYL domains n=1 Tax=Gracilimonas mengyeensis TaxID=1302730 RepID=A0A521FCL0_9BACT|nr:YafY family protein [Gracilimonas mengyeensis]SMO93899.1 Predicted DNA-binding transcriptional regulator YafY, contains an HTH and WYL domains [Gracilimonas mengyeensis]